MKFTGQVKIPEVDHPGVPATFLIEKDQAEVLLDGESLGRWSLYDVEAARLVANAFSVKLGDEEMTFLADEPMDFAYKGVEHMKETWARYRSMTLPRRLVAVSRSRKAAKPSRLADVREAMLQNVQGRRTGQATAPSATPIPATSPTPIEHPVGDEQDAAVESAAPHEEEIRLRPGAGLFARRASDDEMPQVLDPEAGRSTAERVGPGVGLFPPVEDEPVAPRSTWWEEAPVGVDGSDGGRRSPEPEVEDRDEGGAVEVTPPAADDAGSPLEPVAAESPPSPAASAPSPDGDGPVIVDLDRLDESETSEEPDRPVVDEMRAIESSSQEEPGEEREPVLAAAAVSQEKGGLLGAVRSAFVRNRSPHEHVFVEAPGGMGIVRQICTECGYISIGVSD